MSHTGAQGAGAYGRAESLAYRMLRGAGHAALVAYRLEGQPCVDSLAHGLLADGSIVVASTTVEAVGHPQLLVRDRPLDVRLDVAKFAPEPGIRITCASAHMLGGLEWFSDLRAQQLMATCDVPEIVATVASGPRGVLGVVRTNRLMLHHGGGATAVSFGDLVERHRREKDAPVERIESLGVDLALSVDRLDLGLLCDAAAHGWVDAHTLVQRPAPGVQAAGRDYVVDVDLSGITVLRNGRDELSVFFVPFADGPASVERLPQAVGTLLGGSSSVS